MDLKREDRKTSDRTVTDARQGKRKRQIMSLNKEARMILLMTRVRQTNSEALQEQSNLLDVLKNTRNAIKQELKIIKGIEVEKKEEEEVIAEPAEVIETDINTKLNINPNLELVRQIKKNAKSKLNTGHHKSENLKHTGSKTNGYLHLTKHRKSESTLEIANRPPFKC